MGRLRGTAVWGNTIARRWTVGWDGPGAGGVAADVTAQLESQLFALAALRERVRAIGAGLGGSRVITASSAGLAGLLGPWQGPAQRVFHSRVVELGRRIDVAEGFLDEAIVDTRRALATLTEWGG